MKKLTTFILIFAIYSGLIAPIGLQMNLQVNAQIVRGKTRDIKQTNMNLATENGLQFRLSEGVEGAETREVQPQINTDPLTESETSNLLKRIPAIKRKLTTKQILQNAPEVCRRRKREKFQRQISVGRTARNAENQCRRKLRSHSDFRPKAKFRSRPI